MFFSLKNYQALNDSNQAFDFCKQESIVSYNMYTGYCQFLTTSLHWYKLSWNLCITKFMISD